MTSMIKKAALAFGVVVVAALLSSFSSQAKADVLGDFCEDLWPDHPSMQITCIERQVEAFHLFSNWMEEHGLTAEDLGEGKTAIARVGRTCGQLWKPNFEMMNSCVRTETKALIKLGRLNK